MPTSKNTYFEGLDQDSSKSKFKPSKYFSLKNGRVVTEEGLSTGSIENESGMSLSFKIPDTEAVYRVRIKRATLSVTGAITINGTNLNYAAGSVPSDVETLYNDMVSIFGAEISNNNISLHLGTEWIYIVGLDTTLTVTAGGDLQYEEVVSAKSNNKIIGWQRLRDFIILFTTNSVSESPDGTAGQIWKIKYDESNEIIENIGTSNTLTAKDHLIYNNILDFSLYFPIGTEAIGRYENSDIGRVYWTDGNNPLRVINIFDDSFILSPAQLEIIPDFKISQPVIQSIGSGDIPVGSMVQYGYRLLDTSGVETNISPLTPPLHLTEDDPYSDGFNDSTLADRYEGSSKGDAENKSVTYTIDNIDTNYDVIQHVVVIYENEDTPQAYQFGEEFIPSNGSLEVIHDGSETYIDITRQELNALSSNFEICKTIAVKDDRLVAANTQTRRFEVDYDTRAYRFSASQFAVIHDSNGFTEANIDGTATTISYPSDSTLDAINPDEATYRYQSDGSTLGGEGTNVKYEFVNTIADEDGGTITLIGDDTTVTRAADPWVEVNKFPANQSNIDLGIPNQTYPIERSFKNYKSPFIDHILKGYMRGETYRFGITFYDKKGNPSYVQWIGDIKFPEPNDGYYIGERPSFTQTLIPLGIKFTVDTSSLDVDKIQGFRITRLQREVSDMTSLGTGIQTGMNILSDNPDGIASSPRIFTLKDNPSKTSPSLSATSTSVFRYCTFNSPLVQFADKTGFSVKADDYLETVDFFGHSSTDFTSGSTNADYYKTDGTPFGVPTTETNTINNARIIRDGEYASDFANGIANISSIYIDPSPLDNDITPRDIGDPKLLCEMNNTISWFDGDYTVLGVGSAYMKSVAYRRTVGKQYGGNTYENRSKNTNYIPCSGYYPIDITTAASVDFDVFGGDTYVVYYDIEYMQAYQTPDTNVISPWNDPSENEGNRRIIAMMFPVETTINTELRQNRHFAADREAGNFGTHLLNNYEYNKVYSQENNTKKQFIAKDFLLTGLEEHSHRIWASEPKLDGELIDSWRKFKVNNNIDVTGTYGPINKIINFRDFLYYFQDNAFGIASINERVITNDATGAELVLGTGQVLDDYRYISTVAGCQHKFAVVETGNSLYFLDANLRKFFRFSGEGVQPLSDMSGLSAFLDTKMTGGIQNTDKTLFSGLEALIQAGQRPAIGIHGVYDHRFNRVLFTILDGSFVDNVWVEDNSTFSFNEVINGFESFYDFTPKLYLNAGRRILSTDPSNMENAYIHNRGSYGVYYDASPGNTELVVISNSNPDVVKTFNNVEYNMELFNGTTDVPNETWDSIRVYNDYQNSGTVTLTPGTNIQRRNRTWRLFTPRDNATDDPRMRDFNMFIELKYDNSDNYRMIMHDITNHFV